MVAASALKYDSQSATNDLPPETVIFGRSVAMRELRRKINRLASANVPVLLQGESGTGKDILAKLFHLHSPWHSGPFVKVNCPAIPGTLIESELFGYERGAFTGANGSKPGRVEMAHRGTLFLDEISEMSFDLQAKLLQLLQDGQFCRIGSQEDRRVEVRVVCATNRDLQAEIAAGRFRQDLYYRIAVVTLRVPPLRERREDIPDIVEFLFHHYSGKYNSSAPPISAEMMSQLQRYSWPGNVRELENVVRRYVILGTEEPLCDELRAHSIEKSVDDLIVDGELSLKVVTRRAIAEIERKLILKVLQSNNWNRKKASAVLGISYRALLYKIQQAGLPPARTRSDSELRMPPRPA